ncbi:mCG125550 [Mus musculus]|nr:mCG125550 [Mus musculus]
MDAVLASACLWAYAPRTAPPSAGELDRLWDSECKRNRNHRDLRPGTRCDRKWGR